MPITTIQLPPLPPPFPPPFIPTILSLHSPFIGRPSLLLTSTPTRNGRGSGQWDAWKGEEERRREKRSEEKESEGGRKRKEMEKGKHTQLETKKGGRGRRDAGDGWEERGEGKKRRGEGGEPKRMVVVCDNVR